MRSGVFTAALAVLVLAWPTGVAAQEPAAEAKPQEALPVPTAADFGALPLTSGPRLSPDGQWVAMRALVGGKTRLALVDLSTPDHKVRTTSLPAKHQLEWYRWAGSNRLLISISRMDVLMGDDVRVTRLFSLDLAAGKMIPIGPKLQGVDGDDLVHVDRNGAFVLLSTQPSIYEYPSVYRIDLATGKSSQIVHPEDHVWEWIADRDGVVRAGLGINESGWWMIYRSTGKESFRRTIRRDGRSTGRKDEVIGQFELMPGTDQGLAVASGQSGRFGVYRYDFRTDSLGERLYEHADVDVDGYDTDTDGALSNVSFTSERDEVLWFDPLLKRQQERIDRAMPGRFNHIVSASADRMRILVYSGAVDHPGSFLLLDRKTNQMDVFYEVIPEVLDKRLAKTAPVRYTARDGLEIPGYLTLPPGKGDKGLPLIVMPHGGPFARDSLSYDAWAQFLTSRGYVVLQPNFRGSTGYGRQFVEKGTGQWGRGMQDDLDDGVKWLASRGTIDLKRVCIMGASYGGYAAMWAAVRNPDIYRCAISFAGVSDLPSQLRYSRESFVAPRYFRDWRDRVRGDKDFDLQQISPLRQASRISIPLLIAHGTEDHVVPISQSRRIHQALLKLGRAHDYVEYKDEPHGFETAGNGTDFLERVGAFLDKYNPS